MSLPNLLLPAILLLSALTTQAQTPASAWRYLAPDNTGVGGDFHYVMEPDRFGNITSTFDFGRQVEGYAISGVSKDSPASGKRSWTWRTRTGSGSAGRQRSLRRWR